MTGRTLDKHTIVLILMIRRIATIIANVSATWILCLEPTVYGPGVWKIHSHAVSSSDETVTVLKIGCIIIPCGPLHDGRSTNDYTFIGSRATKIYNLRHTDQTTIITSKVHGGPRLSC